MVGRYVVDSYLKTCLYAGIKINRTNGEAMVSQWEYQIGPLEGIKCADQFVHSLCGKREELS